MAKRKSAPVGHACLYVAEHADSCFNPQKWEPLARVRPNVDPNVVTHRLGEYVGKRGANGRRNWTMYRVVRYERTRHKPVVQVDGGSSDLQASL